MLLGGEVKRVVVRVLSARVLQCLISLSLSLRLALLLLLLLHMLMLLTTVPRVGFVLKLLVLVQLVSGRKRGCALHVVCLVLG